MISDCKSKLKNLMELLRVNINSDRGIIFIEGSKEEKFVSYKDLYEESLKALGALQVNGVKHGDEVILQIKKNDNFLYMFWACILGGIIPVPISIGSKDEQRRKIFKVWKRLRNPVLVSEFEVLKKLEEFSDRVNDELYIKEIKNSSIAIDDILNNKTRGKIYDSVSSDVAYVQFSSGSTGEPKGVVLSHMNILTNIQAIVESVGYDELDSCLSWLPLTHDMGMIGIHLTSMVLEINQFIMPSSLFIKQPNLWIKKASEHKVSFLASPNFGFKYFLNFFKEDEDDLNLSKIRIIVNGAEPISYELSQKFLRVMSKYGLKDNVMFNVYGLAEATLAVSFPHVGEVTLPRYLDRNSLDIGCRIKTTDRNDSNAVALVDVGYPIKDCSVRICGNSDEILESDTVGHIQIKGGNVTRCYYNDSQATTSVLTQDDWLRTGDIGFITCSRLTITGRQKDIIFLNGQNFYSHDIERVIESIDSLEINDVAVCCSFDKESQSDELIVFVLFKKKIEDFITYILQIKSHVSEKIGIVIKHIIPVRLIPKTTSGKKQRYMLIRQFEYGEFDETMKKLTLIMTETNIKGDAHMSLPFEDRKEVVVLEDIENKIVEIFTEVLGNKKLNRYDSFETLCLDSLSMMIILTKINKAFGISISFNDIVGKKYINDFANLVIVLLNNRSY